MKSGFSLGFRVGGGFSSPAGGFGSGFIVPAAAAAPTLVTSGLILQLDASNASSYPGSGTTWTDITGDYDATITANGSYSAGSGGIIQGDGAGYIAQVADAAAIRGSVGGVLTLQIWARVRNYANNNGLFGKQFGSATYDGYSFALISSQGVRLQMNGSAVNGGYNSSTGVWSLDTWHLFTAVVAFGGTARAYVDSSKVIEVSNAETSIPSNNANLRIGTDIQDPGDRFPTMDVGAFYVYSRELSASEVADNYSGTKARYGL